MNFDQSTPSQNRSVSTKSVSQTSSTATTPSSSNSLIEPSEDSTLNNVSNLFYGGERVVPGAETREFSFRELWAFTGPGFLMSIAYLDPGNIESDLQSGIVAKYSLLWVLLGATLLGLAMQRLAVKIGVVTGLDLAEMCHKQYKTVPRIILWLMVEVAIIGSDMQEVIGTAIAIYLLSYKRIPLYIGVLITVLDTMSFLFLDKYKLRRLELFFGFLITTMAVSFGYQYIISDTPQMEVIKGMFIPWSSDYRPGTLLQAVGIIGAVIMPHNLYLHSALVKSREINRNEVREVKKANRYYFIEATIALAVSFFINVFVVSVFAHDLYGKTNQDVIDRCSNSSFSDDILHAFDANNATADINIYKAGLVLGCFYGGVSMYVWAIGILAAGQSSTMTGTYAGQFAMEGFLNLQWARWKRVLFTRTVAIMPAFYVAFFSRLEDLTKMNDILNAVMALQLPFAAIPTVAFSSSVALMKKEFVNGTIEKAISIALSFTVIGINLYFIIANLQQVTLTAVMIFGVVLFGTFYIVFNIYLILHMMVHLGNKTLATNSFVKRYIFDDVNLFSNMATMDNGL
ncbi:protein Malvolio [Anopheles stephensi]|uniref:protein Malvolio n=1 Tax=Anopheles stephensi TaxID=30069 RepID=UPI0016589F0E|nr:protein Malvolio [Anopheles stephensi]XP_035909279.1 protein Malvolio [Anopheles stephensi]XP_035909280.1 protein Malvolio [Anopheles stephensi]XP_035909281.1 protein Malvolio [Anopheles stephensi]XP_035909282.1 protein Malvolio [Anopheles stephensi]